jgi:hypothetical protein
VTDYNLRLRLGDHWWDIDYLDGDVARPAVLAGLSYGWSAPQDRGWPPPRNVLPFDTLTVTIRADAAVDVADIAKGQVGYFEFTPDGYSEPLVRFAGRLGDPSIKPRLGADGHGDGVYLSVTVSDYLVDLTGRTFLDGTGVIGPSSDRLNVSIRALGLILGYGEMFKVDDATLAAYFGFPGFDIEYSGPTTDLAAFQLLRFSFYGGGTPVANYDDNGDLDPVYPFLFPLLPDPFTPDLDLGLLTLNYGLDPVLSRPYEFGLVGGLLTIAGGGLGANLVPYESLVWSRDREPNYLEMDSTIYGPSYAWRGQAEGAPYPSDPSTRRTGRFKTDDVNWQSMQRDIEEHDPWGPESFIVRAYLDPTSVETWFKWPYREFTVANLADLRVDQSPGGHTWVAGMLGGARLTIPADGKWYVSAVMRRSRIPASYRSYGTEGLTFDSVLAHFPGVTFDQVDPDLTFHDLDLIGEPT